MAELKPCPFCGVIPTVEFDNRTKKYWISCNNPNCMLQPIMGANINKSVIVREWNRRHNGE